MLHVHTGSDVKVAAIAETMQRVMIRLPTLNSALLQLRVLAPLGAAAIAFLLLELKGAMVNPRQEILLFQVGRR